MTGTSVAERVAPHDAPAAGRFAALDGLRAVAVTLAVLQHVAFVSGAAFNNSFYGETVSHLPGPIIFFALSAFLLYRPMVSASIAGRPTARVGDFWRRRALRVLPAYWLALTLIAVFFGVNGLSGIRNIVSVYTLTHVYDEPQFYHGLVQSWTLAVEIGFYVFLPFYAFALRRATAGRSARDRLRIELAGAAILYSAGVGWRWFVFYGPVSLPFIAKDWFPGHLDVFALGIAVAALYAHRNARGLLPGRIARLVLTWLCPLLAVLTAWIATTLLDLPRGSFAVGGGRTFIQQALFGLTALLLLLPCVFGAQERGLYRRSLQARPVVYLGMVSFGVYLWHNAWLEQGREWAGFESFQGNYVLLLAFAFAFALLCAACSYHFVERPLLAFKNRRRDIHERAPVAP